MSSYTECKEKYPKCLKSIDQCPLDWYVDNYDTFSAYLADSRSHDCERFATIDEGQSFDKCEEGAIIGPETYKALLDKGWIKK